MRTVALILVAALSHCSPANAAFDTGNDLYDFCTSKDSSKQLLCLGLVTGYFEGMQAGYECGTDPKITRQQLRDIVVKFLRDNPAERHRPGAVLAARAYFLSFNCKRAS